MSEAPAAEPLRVCVVDDDPFVTASLATILSAEPDIVVAGEGHDGEEAVALFERERPDVLLMDIQMPGVGGLEAAERILACLLYTSPTHSQYDGLPPVAHPRLRRHLALMM